MSDANVDHGASLLITVLTEANGFHPQNSSSEDTDEEAVLKGKTGNLADSNVFNEGQSFSQTFGFHGTDLRTAMGAFATAFGTVIGSGATAICPTAVDISYPQGGKHPELTVSAHNHGANNHDSATNPPRTYDISALIPASGLGIPNIFGDTIVTADCSPSSGNINAAIDHKDKIDGATGGHFVGENVGCRVSASMDFEGICGPKTDVDAVWQSPKRVTSDDNADLDTSSMTGHVDVDHN